ncbi:MerR family transcriptional regulator [Pikeienuella piscinae]|uniref:MerR family transcriptional regulator n=1 Tax=Pikeienuella piscinae TaxID=2748098 RepID=A0A7L5BY85_9RHOB|nr:MerR family transcriptional regulator [Pikeienuella piscinae]QIE55196.1 MerR family transcriptional regulator [Pikeienuella piscinae]
MRHDETATARRTRPGDVAPQSRAPEKSADAFRTISEVAELLDTPAHVLRFWESKFSQIKPMKRGGGRRYYRPEDVALLRGIRELLYEDGLTIKGVQKVLRERGQRHVAGLAEAEAEPAPDVDATLARLEALRNRLRQE